MAKKPVISEDISVLVERIRQLEGVVMAGSLQVGALGGGALGAYADCSCQNCSCDSRRDDSCVCNPRCSCQGHTARTGDVGLRMLLGEAANMPMKDIQTLVELRDKIKPK